MFITFVKTSGYVKICKNRRVFNPPGMHGFKPFGIAGCETKAVDNKTIIMIKIALPVTLSNQIDGHFGHCEMYSVYSVSDTNQILGVQSINPEQGCGCKSNIAATLAAQGVSIMLAGGIGNGAINVLNSQGIKVIRGCSGNATEAVKKFLAGTLEDSGESCSQHEHHHGQV